MTSDSKECPIDELQQLVDQTDLVKLRTTLLDTIQTKMPQGEIFLFEHGISTYPTDDGSINFLPRLMGYRGNNSKYHDHVNIAQSTEKPQLTVDDIKYAAIDDYVQVFVVEGEASGRGLLILINPELIAEDYINTLLKVYNNLVKLIRNRDSDSLTGLFNRQSFDDKTQKLYSALEQQNRPGDTKTRYCLALLDIDHFKNINDEHGHVYGDEVLLLFANLMKKTFRDSDLLFRYGGEEFAVLLKGLENETAEAVLQRFRNSVENYPFPLKNKVTVSIGFCKFHDDVPLAQLLEQADRALYYAKEHGRNQIQCYDTLHAEHKISVAKVDSTDIEIF